MNPDELRDRHRKRVKQRYYQALHGLSQARELVRQLTDQHRRLLVQQETVEVPENSVTRTRQHEMRRNMEMADLADALRRERQRLMELLGQREKLQDRVATLLDEMQRDQVRRCYL